MKRTVRSVFVLFSFALLTTTVSAEPYTVFTYNLGLLRVFGSDLVPLVAARTKAAPRALAAFVTDSKPQIILLEEAWEDTAADAIAKELSPLGYVANRPDIHSFLGLSSGLLLMVKSPLRVVDWKFTPFTRNTFTDGFARKGVLEATLTDDDTGARFVLIGTHTVAVDTDNGIPKDKGQVAVITSQMTQILDALASRSQSGALPALILGDFNVGPDYADAIYRMIADVPGIQEAPSVFNAADPFITWDRENPLVKFGHYPGEPSARIDHLFLQSSATTGWKVLDVQVVQKDPVPGVALNPSDKSSPIPAPLSDHYGLLTKVSLGQP